MPALHVVGEIVGASGLRPREALSVAHLLDALALHPSSRRSFFCRWRLGFRAFGSHGNSESSSWRLLQGASRGQTQVHAWSAVTPLEGETITKSSHPCRDRRHPEEVEEEEQETSPPIELETLWSHPIDLHLAVSELLSLPASWPFLEFQVWSLDEFHRERLVGMASMPLPASQHEFFMDLPLTKVTRPASLLETVVDFFDLKHDDAEAQWADEEHDDEDGVVATSVGTLYVRLAVVQQGFQARGVLT